MLTEEKDVDRRVRRTKRMFRQAFIKLLEKKDYKHITVTDIVEYADYNRATFYLHYKYKEDLAEEVVESMINDFIYAFRFPYQNKNHQDLSKTPPSDIILFDYILENRDFFKLWKKTECIPHLQERFIQTIKVLTKEAIVPLKNLGPKNDKDLFVTFQAYGIMGLITEWIQSDFESPPEYMAAQLIDIICFYPQAIMSSSI
ncbi:TetR/AcrR family transcriptional regulator [Bacillus benzoevorans]|uniref:AcrR family transcriptional regulator n=1 Tax=Bacillus benzoevorans TaxID=1456 RepID=A0A7X0HM93_9BACI|nr:TetR/AcrR family transcriptional regulator [Bacillus benzoevorans]MBB6443423.1 AcrR family transcriptional regulator [Bacillus benzoevorans]